MSNTIKSKEIILNAIEKYKPVKVLLLFSGGHDSLCSTHFAANFLTSINARFTIYHGNTSIGIKESTYFVIDVCKKYNWSLYMGSPDHGATYEDLVKKYGFPGQTKLAHQMMYRYLKERALRRCVTHFCKSKPTARENVLLITGIRNSESKIRMGYRDHTTKEDSRIWCNPLIEWADENVDKYMEEKCLPKNPVKQQICISGECLCGAWARKEEFTEIKHCFPDAAKEIERLHEIAKANGFPWAWGIGPNIYNKEKLKEQKMYMCVGCEAQRFAE